MQTPHMDDLNAEIHAIANKLMPLSGVTPATAEATATALHAITVRLDLMDAKVAKLNDTITKLLYAEQPASAGFVGCLHCKGPLGQCLPGCPNHT